MTSVSHPPQPTEERTPTATRWRVCAETDEVVQVVAEAILSAARSAITARGRFKLVIPGGRTPEAVFRRLATQWSDWSNWEIFFSDERCLPPDHPDRNSRLAQELWLARVPIPQERIHIIPAGLGPWEAARRYADVVRQGLPFDLVWLGLGEDGHTASLFPGRNQAEDDLVQGVIDAPKPPPERVTLTRPALNETELVLLMATGRSKQEAVRRWRAGEPLPVSRLGGHRGLEVVLDREAAHGL